VFKNAWAERHRDLLDRFFTATKEAKEILGTSHEEWQRLAGRIGVSDPAAIEIYRRRYLDGIPRRSVGEEAADARALYRVLAETGGADLVGPARELDPGTYYVAGPSE
jgi:NitT/TauT family transport system substrate-binding protein